MRPNRRVGRLVFLQLQCLPAAFALTAWTGGVLAQSVRVEPSLYLSETFTDNGSASRDGGSDWITEVSPAISVSRTGGRVTGQLSASLRNVIHASGESDSNSFVTLNGRGEVEVVDDSFFIDITGSVGRSNLSTFSGRSQWDSNSTGSETETRYLSVAPRWTGRLGTGDVQATVRYNSQALSSGSGTSSQGNGTLNVSVGDPTAGELFGWSVDYLRSDTGYQGDQRNVSDNSLTGTLTYRVTPQFSLRTTAGLESNTFQSSEEDSGSTTSYGFNWTPTPRTSISGTRGNHVYGDTYDFRLSHRRPLSSWDLSLSRSITSAFQSATSSLSSYYYNLFSSALTSQFPDPVQRDQAVRELMKALGIPVGSSLGNFNSNAFFMDRRIQAGFSLVGARNTLAFSVSRSNRTRTSDDLATDPNDDFASNSDIKSVNATVSLSHKLTPNSGLRGAFYWTRSSGSGSGSDRESRDFGMTVGYTTQLGAKTNGSVNFRHQKSAGDDEFTENALIAALSMSF